MKKDPAGILVEGLSYELYCDLRGAGDPALKAYKLWKDEAIRLDAMDRQTFSVEALVSVAVGIVVTYQVTKLAYITDHEIWIRSPSGNTIVQLPLFDALRVIRKREWQFARVELSEAKKRRFKRA